MVTYQQNISWVPGQDTSIGTTKSSTLPMGYDTPIAESEIKIPHLGLLLVCYCNIIEVWKRWQPISGCLQTFTQNSLLYSVFLLTLFLITFSPRAVDTVKCPWSSFFFIYDTLILSILHYIYITLQEKHPTFRYRQILSLAWLIRPAQNGVLCRNSQV